MLTLEMLPVKKQKNKKEIYTFSKKIDGEGENIIWASQSREGQ